jgi:hypothetical protein
MFWVQTYFTDRCGAIDDSRVEGLGSLMKLFASEPDLHPPREVLGKSLERVQFTQGGDFTDQDFTDFRETEVSNLIAACSQKAREIK